MACDVSVSNAGNSANNVAKGVAISYNQKRERRPPCFFRIRSSIFA
jgi:hypothetical protein